MLRAALLAPAEAAGAWRALTDQVALDDLWDAEIHRLLPLVHANLRAAGIDDPDLPRLKGLHRRQWYENQMRIHRVRPGLAALADANIPVLFLKGLPLALRYYGDPGLRPMHDVDVLVPWADADRALDVLEAAGWRDTGGLTRAQLWRTHHGSGLVHPDGGELDLHWHLGTPLLLPDDAPASSDDFWAEAVPLEDAALGVHGVTLAPADMLLHVIAHGLWAGSASTVRWVSDATVVVRRSEVDWDRLVDQATRRRIAPLVGDALRYLRAELAVQVPIEAIERLAAVTTTRRERRLLRALAGPVTGPAVLGGLPHLRSYWAYTRLKWGPVRSARELPRFVADLWGLGSPWQVPAGAVVRAWQRLHPTTTPPARHQAARAETAPPTVSVVVPTHERPDHLARCLDALAAQADRPEQVIVVRSPLDAGAAAVVARHAELVTDVVISGTTVVERLHAGAAMATADVVAFTDDDAAPHPDWVRRIRAHLTDPTVGAVGGRDLQPEAERKPPPRRIGLVLPGGRVVGGHSDGQGAARDVEHLRGVNMAVRRDLLLIPAGLRGPGAQGYHELATSLWVVAAGQRVRYDPALLVDHHLAPRYEHGDGDRHHAATPKRVDDAYNQSYVLFSLRRRGRWARLAYVIVLGDRSVGGLLRSAAAAAHGDRRLAAEWRPLLRAHLEAWRAARRAPLRGIRPDEPFPAP